MSFSRGDKDGDLGTFYAVDELGTVVRVIPEEVLEDDGQR